MGPNLWKLAESQNSNSNKLLEKVSLQGNGITTIGLALKGLRNLKYLRLDENRLKSVAGIEAAENLTYLDVSGNQLTNAKVCVQLGSPTTLHRNSGIQIIATAENIENNQQPIICLGRYCGL